MKPIVRHRYNNVPMGVSYCINSDHLSHVEYTSFSNNKLTLGKKIMIRIPSSYLNSLILSSLVKIICKVRIASMGHCTEYFVFNFSNFLRVSASFPKVSAFVKFSIAFLMLPLAS